MGLFAMLFGRSDLRESILRGITALADETERVYHNHLGEIAPTCDGVLKARLLSSAFGVAVYSFSERAQSEEHAIPFVYACIEVAMRPFQLPTESRKECVSSAGMFMTRIVKLIDSELTYGPSTIDNTTDAFHQLVEVYHCSLAESVGKHRYETQMRSNLDLVAQGIVWTHFRFLAEYVQQTRK